jgi:hypothetical protein
MRDTTRSTILEALECNAITSIMDKIIEFDQRIEMLKKEGL